MKDVDIAYAAGQLDADGCISTWRNSGGYLAVSVNVVSQDRDLLEWLVETFGGNIYTMGTARAFQWRPSDWESFLVLLLPYLRTKKPQAELVLSYRDTVRKRGRGRRSAEFITYQVSIDTQSKALNRRYSEVFAKNSRMGR